MRSKPTVPLFTTDSLPLGGRITGAWMVWATEDRPEDAMRRLSEYAARAGAHAVVATRLAVTGAVTGGASVQLAYGTAVTIAAD